MIADLLNAPAPLTAADALAMCLVSAGLGAIGVLILLLAWVRISIWREDRQAEAHRISGRTILRRI